MHHGDALFGGISADLLADPLAFLSAEHARQRALIGHLARLARQPGAPGHGAIARALAAWFACELPLHLRDEAESLHPRLAAFAPALVADLAAAGAALDARRPKLRAALAALATGHRAPAAFRDDALGFAGSYRQHLAREEAELMPLARERLGALDCAAIATEMAARRS
jgi:hypothetical protein